MATNLEETIDDFARFAKEHSSSEVTIDDLYDLWRERARKETDAMAVRASLEDMKNGETGRPFDEFAEEFQEKNNISK